jgi:nicotinate phosphoribosyltransferase
MKSILDNDLYKFTMQQAALELYPNAEVTYRFTNRDPSMRFTPEAFEALNEAIFDMDALKLSFVEYQYLDGLGLFTESYLNWLMNFRFNHIYVFPQMDEDGNLSLDIRGRWIDTILYEVPLMALISETYFKYVNKDWKTNINGTEMTIDDAMIPFIQTTGGKKEKLRESGCLVADFGTRRRLCFEAQDILVMMMKHEDFFVGTSNVHLAMKHGLSPIGTMAHEWVMANSVVNGLRHANRTMMEDWVKVYDADLGIALTDTYGTEAFFDDFNLKLSKTFDGVRHDSGCPYKFTDRVIEHYQECRIDPTTKTIVFSDGLDVDEAIKLREYCEGKIRCSFGIGTNFTNDFYDAEGNRVKPMNMVIKLRTMEGVEVVKMSDNPGKATGDEDAVRVAKWTFFGTPL